MGRRFFIIVPRFHVFLFMILNLADGVDGVGTRIGLTMEPWGSVFANVIITDEFGR